MEPSRAQGQHAGLRRAQILRAAVALADREGAEALSMRRLARELGVEAMTLYHHVQNKDALEDAIVEHVLGESIRDPGGAETWQEAIKAYARDLHDGLREHPGAVALLASRSAMTAQNLHMLEALLRVLSSAGFAPGTALQMVHASAIAVIGLHATTRHAPRLESASLTEGFPLTQEALTADVADLGARVEFMLDALITGYESLLPA